MVSRLVEQHRGFTPLPLSSFWFACVVSLPLSFSIGHFCPEWHLNEISSFYIQDLSTTLLYVHASIVAPPACVHTV